MILVGIVYLYIQALNYEFQDFCLMAALDPALVTVTGPVQVVLRVIQVRIHRCLEEFYHHFRPVTQMTITATATPEPSPVMDYPIPAIPETQIA